MALTVAVDIGGTFTDLLGYDEASGRLVSAKSFDHARRSGAGDSGLSREDSAPAAEDRYVRPRLDRRHQHRRRAQRRAHGVGRHARNARCLHDRPGKPSRSLRCLVQTAEAARSAPSDFRSRRASGRRRRRAHRLSMRRRRRTRPTVAATASTPSPSACSIPGAIRRTSSHGRLLAEGCAGRLRDAVA